MLHIIKLEQSNENATKDEEKITNSNTTVCNIPIIRISCRNVFITLDFSLNISFSVKTSWARPPYLDSSIVDLCNL